MKIFETTSQFNPENQSELSNSTIKRNENTATLPTMKEVFKSAKEKISSYLKYKDLKIKEYFGQLNQKDFDQLLSFDFQEQLRDTLSIEGVFSPHDELTKIKSLPREQKREALATFKENLARQREALAACRVFVERSIEFNNDIPREKLITLIEKFSKQYGFNDKQKQVIKQLIDEYYGNRQKVLKVRQKFSDNYELINKLTDVNIEKDEKLNVSVGPMTIDIETGGFNAKRLYEKIDKPVINSFKSGGFASQSTYENPVYYIVINQEKWIKEEYDDPSGEKRKRHEYEHQKNKLFRAVFNYQEAPTQLCGYIGEKDIEIKKIILEDFLNVSRASALEKAKDEITASLYDRDLETLQKQLEQFFFSNNKECDYLGYLLNWKEFKNDLFYQETAQRMLIQEYKTIIESAVSSYSELVKKGEYSTQEATALLTDKPLTDWPKTTKRLLKQRKVC